MTDEQANFENATLAAALSKALDPPDPPNAIRIGDRLWLRDRKGTFADPDDALYCPRSGELIVGQGRWCALCCSVQGALGAQSDEAELVECRDLVRAP